MSTASSGAGILPANPCTTDKPLVSIDHLEELWFQVGGTLCNLTCHHCFISCSPKNRNFGFLTLAQVRDRLEESVSLGVKEYYFTGGEPFLNPEMTEILELTLQYGPATILTNGTLFTGSRAESERWLARLRKADEASLYSLEFRVSIDGHSPETNDPIRGIGTFDRAMAGIRALVREGFLPIITATAVWPADQNERVRAALVEALQGCGFSRPRLKILPTLQIGAEEQRTTGYRPDERVTAEMLAAYDTSQLVCQHSRVVTDRGVHVCPILIEASDALLGRTLAESIRPFAITHGACTTCYQYGAICTNASSAIASWDR